MDRVRPYGARHTFFAVQGGERPFDGGRITADERHDRRASAAQTHAQNIRMSKRKGVPEDRHQRFTVWLMAPILEPFRHLRCIAAVSSRRQIVRAGAPGSASKLRAITHAIVSVDTAGFRTGITSGSTT